MAIRMAEQAERMQQQDLRMEILRRSLFDDAEKQQADDEILIDASPQGGREVFMMQQHDSTGSTRDDDSPVRVQILQTPGGHLTAGWTRRQR